MTKLNKYNQYELRDFIRESNLIEGIVREPTGHEIVASTSFLRLPNLTVKDMITIVNVYQPDAVIRDETNLNVIVNNYVAPEGDPKIPLHLEYLLHRAKRSVASPYEVHVEYQVLHPFTDGNGRSGRILWLWMMLRQDFRRYSKYRMPPHGFLQMYYYQSLAAQS